MLRNQLTLKKKNIRQNTTNVMDYSINFFLNGFAFTVEVKSEGCDDDWNGGEEIEEGGLSIQLRK